MEVVAGVGHGHIDAEQVLKDKGRSVKRLLKGTGVQITSLARYGNPLDPDPQKREAFVNELKMVIDAAESLKSRRLHPCRLPASWKNEDANH